MQIRTINTLFSIITSIVMVGIYVIDPNYSYFHYFFLLVFVQFFLLFRSKVSNFNFAPIFLGGIIFLPFLVTGEKLFLGSVNLSRITVGSLINKAEINNFAMLNGLLSLNGVLLATYFFKPIKRTFNKIELYKAKDNTIDIWAYGIICFIIFLIYLVLSRNSGNIIGNTYGELHQNKEALKFTGVYYFFYTVLLMLFVDALYSAEKRVRKIKLRIVISLILYVMIFANLLKGNRNIAGLIFAFFALPLFFYQATQYNAESKKFYASLKKKSKYLFVIIFVLFFLVGIIRNSLATRGVSTEVIVQSLLYFYKSSSWMGGYYATLGAAQEYTLNTINYLYGKTYLDYILSLPPSFIANALNYTRPLDIPANAPGEWFRGFTVGGVHPSVVAFKNFGFLGVYLIFTLYGYFFFKLESRINLFKPNTLFLYACVLLSSLHLMWYGEMYMFRALMGYYVVKKAYQYLVYKRNVTGETLSSNEVVGKITGSQE